ncbi:MAG: hypothetical protein QF692_04625 [Alphaproteobacteria bacterium]|jgi:hypothetical protein|nr:hypothetical protein [Alphaproteobacteria bacterium]MDP7222533.1 hypothetical protein [Alphaproteobacteria bacterium]
MAYSSHLIRSILLVTALLAFAPVSASAQTAISPEQAYSYYQNCTSTRDPNISGETQDIFCKCTAMKMQSDFYVEDMVMMQGDSDPARKAINKMLLNVYAPCMEFPVRDLIFKRCIENEYNVQKDICECLANRMADYTASSARKYLSDILKNDPNITDPMGPIVNHPKFIQHEKRTALACIQGEPAP